MKKDPLPSWMRLPLTQQKGFSSIRNVLKNHHLSTVCEEALCPNRAECFAKKRATFLALGNHCTRSCAFCNISSARTLPPPDPKEAERIALCVQELQLNLAVVTMVTRDDLPDQGASHIASIIREIRKKSSAKIEVLTSDFSGNFSFLKIVLDEAPEIFNHNLETVRKLTPKIRAKAQYQRSLEILRFAKNSSFQGKVKSGLMVGLGETKEQVFQTLEDLHEVGCDIVTIGQYLQPSPQQIKVKEYISPSLFQEYERYGRSCGLPSIFSGPFVRSSYCAEELFSSL